MYQARHRRVEFSNHTDHVILLSWGGGHNTYSVSLAHMKLQYVHVRTVEPPNKGHLGTRASVLYSEVSFIRSVLYRKFHCSYFHVHQHVFFVVLNTILEEAFKCSTRNNYGYLHVCEHREKNTCVYVCMYKPGLLFPSGRFFPRPLNETSV